MTQANMDVEERRLRERVKEAIRARKFTPEETLAMSLSLIDFSLRFRKEADDAFNG